jgi:phospholipase/carboxylesterase
MVPIVSETTPDLRGAPVFMGAGRSDPLISQAETELLAELLRRAGADAALHWDQGGHNISAAERRAAANWMRANAMRGDRGQLGDPTPVP